MHDGDLERPPSPRTTTPPAARTVGVVHPRSELGREALLANRAEDPLAVLGAVGLQHESDAGLANVEVDALAEVDDVEHVRAVLGDRPDAAAASAPGRSGTTVENTSRRPAAVSPRRMHSTSRAASTLPPESSAQTSPSAGGSTLPASSAATDAAPAPSTTSFERSSSRTIAWATSSSETVTISST